MNYKIILFCFIQAILNIAGIAMVREGIKGFKFTTIKFSIFELFNLKIILGVILIGLGFIFTLLILNTQKLSYYQPLSSGITFIVTLAVSLFFLKESISFISILGIFFIVLGCMILSFQK
jgi:drug/metabolite transporter (DMT)-like permease